jgi:SAM-dependent methyltransferase
MQAVASLNLKRVDNSMHDLYPSAVSSTKNGHTLCRICGSEKIIERGTVEFYIGYAWPIYDCDDCGCRFTRHESSTYDLLYSERSSCYSRYIAQSEACKMLFDRGDLTGLKAELSQASKYRFIIEQVDRESTDARILEIGSSRGHLTSYLILAGRNVTGVDTSQKAVVEASAAFGDHFIRAGDSRVDARAPYDVIFHVGTIGCIADPIGMTKKWLDLLKTGGRLLFNAPNRDGCSAREQMWFESAPPPDLVTLFPPGFWRDRFGDVALVSEDIEFCSPEQNLLIALRRLARRKWRKPVPMPLKESERWSTPAPRFSDALWRNLERVARKVAPWSGLLGLAPLHPSEFGLFVQMVKK